MKTYFAFIQKVLRHKEYWAQQRWLLLSLTVLGVRAHRLLTHKGLWNGPFAFLFYQSPWLFIRYSGIQSGLELLWVVYLGFLFFFCWLRGAEDSSKAAGRSVLSLILVTCLLPNPRPLVFPYSIFYFPADLTFSKANSCIKSQFGGWKYLDDHYTCWASEPSNEVIVGEKIFKIFYTL